MKYLSTALFMILFCVSTGFAQMKVGEVPPAIELKGDDGGRLNGSPWSSKEITGKVYTIMYVDPDEKDINVHVEQALKAENFPRDKYGSIAIINMGATWKPNFAIKMILDGKQKEFPNTIYVMDKDKILVDKWKAKNDNYHVMTFGKDGKLLFEKAGKLSDADIKKLIAVIRENL